MERVLGERLRVIALFDAYGQMLTVHQRTLLRLYFLRDLSLGEIAEDMKVTRQAVFDALRRAVDELERLEGAVQALKRQRAVAERADALEQAIRNLDGQLDRATIQQLLHRVKALRKIVS